MILNNVGRKKCLGQNDDQSFLSTIQSIRIDCCGRERVGLGSVPFSFLFSFFGRRKNGNAAPIPAWQSRLLSILFYGVGAYFLFKKKRRRSRSRRRRRRMMMKKKKKKRKKHNRKTVRASLSLFKLVLFFIFFFFSSFYFPSINRTRRPASSLAASIPFCSAGNIDLFERKNSGFFFLRHSPFFFGCISFHFREFTEFHWNFFGFFLLV